MTERHRHYIVHDMEREGSWPSGLRGRRCADATCNHRDDRPVCAGVVTRDPNSRWVSWSRCINTGKVVRDEEPPGHGGPTRRDDEAGGWWYCGMHDPERVSERERARDAERRAHDAVLSERHKASNVLIREAHRWRDDEAATEGFCADGDQCEHHECRLARAVTRYERAYGRDSR